VVNYLIGELNLDQIINSTQVPNLDIITSGSVFPNPEDLVLSGAMREMIEALKLKYNYIILNRAPVGLVVDAIELSNYADITLYVVRKNYTKKEMINLLNNLFARGELKNISLVLNDFTNNAKFGYSYVYT